MPKRKKIIIAAIIIALLAAYLGFAVSNISRSRIDSGIPKDAIAVEIESAHTETIISKVSVKGTVELIEIETVFAQSSAIVKEVYVKEGDEVQAGQALLEYDSQFLEDMQDQLVESRLALKTARLSLEAAQTITSDADERRLEKTRGDYNNTKMLYDAGAATARELDAAAEAIIAAEDQIKATLNHISVLQVTVEQNELRISQIQKKIDSFIPAELAPVSGAVLASYVRKGDVSAQGRQLFEIADISKNNLTIKANVPENDASNLTLGLDVEIRCNAVGQTVYQGKIIKISPIAAIKQIGNSQETALTLEIHCDDAPLKAGYTIDAAIITKIIENAVVVPLMSTVSEPDGKSYVYIVKDDYSVEKRMIELGEYAGIYVEAANIETGEKTILSPSAQIKEGVFAKPVLIRNPVN